MSETDSVEDMYTNFFVFKSLVLIVVVLTFNEYGRGHLSAQTVSGKTPIKDEVSMPDLETQLIPLNQIVNIALKNSPIIKGDSSAVEASKYSVLLNRRNLYDNVSVFGSVASGSQQLGISGTNTGQSVLNGYRFGVNVNVPLSDFLIKNIKVKQAQAQVAELEYRKEQTEILVQKQVVLEYYNLIAAQKVLKVKSESLENFRVLFQLAEKQFRDGTTTLQDYANVSSMMVKAESEYEFAKSSFNISYDQFEYLIGVDLIRIMKK